MKHLIYILSLGALVAAIFILASNPEESRSQLIAGALTGLGMLLNVGTYLRSAGTDHPLIHSCSSDTL